MKTLTNIISKSFTLTIVLFLTGMAANAQAGFNNSLLSELKTELEGFGLQGTGVEVAEFEAEMPVEDWMLQTKAWTNSAGIADVAVEKALEVEHWMVEPFTLESSTQQADPKDESLAIENWMVNPDAWYN